MTAEEIEVKLNLSDEANYLRLIEYFKKPKTIKRLENHFFDSEDWRLSKMGWAVRLRRDANRSIITAKARTIAEIPNLTIRPEIETDIQQADFERIISDGIGYSELPQEITRTININFSDFRLVQKVSFITFRTIVEHIIADLKVNYEIDKTVFGDNSADYELEIELSDRTAHDMVIRETESILKKLEIPLSYQKDSKFTRALERAGTII
jgi:uncharacterized protein YjbK